MTSSNQRWTRVRPNLQSLAGPSIVKSMDPHTANRSRLASKPITWHALSRPAMQHGLPTLFASSLAVFFAAFSAHAEPPRLLFDGLSLNGWTSLNGQPVSEAWEAVDGTLHLKPGRSGGANIVTDREYRDFDLSFEWKITAGGNNGLKYRVRQYGNQFLAASTRCWTMTNTPALVELAGE